jgi:hypothetical protein
MNKKKIFVIIFLIFISSNLFAQEQYYDYKVISIENTKKNHIITLERLNQKFVLISPKIKSIKKCNEVSVNKTYSFCLLKIDIQTTMEPEKRNKIRIDNKVIWDSQSDFDVFYCKDLLGLCYNPPGRDVGNVPN